MQGDSLNVFFSSYSNVYGEYYTYPHQENWGRTAIHRAVVVRSLILYSRKIGSTPNSPGSATVFVPKCEKDKAGQAPTC